MIRFFFPLFLTIAFDVGPAPAQDFDCIIEARQMIDIRSPVEGLIERVARKLRAW